MGSEMCIRDRGHPGVEPYQQAAVVVQAGRHPFPALALKRSDPHPPAYGLRRGQPALDDLRAAPGGEQRVILVERLKDCLLYTSPSPRDS